MHPLRVSDFMPNPCKRKSERFPPTNKTQETKITLLPIIILRRFVAASKHQPSNSLHTHTHTHVHTLSKWSPIHVLRHARNSDILVLKCNEWCTEEPTSKRKKTHTPAALGLRLESHNGKTKLMKKNYETKPKKKKKWRKKNLRNSIEIERTKLKRHSSIPPFSLSPSFLLLLPLPLLLVSSFGELPSASYHTKQARHKP